MHHFPPVIETFLHVLFETGEGRMSDKACTAWAKFLHLIRAIMLEPGVQAVMAKDDPGNSSSTNDIERIKRILLLDDDPQLLNLYQSYLETQGFFCSQTADVAWAFTHFRMSRYDLVLTDFQMPVMNGIKFRRHLSRIDNALWPPFILITGKVNQEIRQLALASGFVTVLKKPQVLGELGSVVNSVLKTD